MTQHPGKAALDAIMTRVLPDDGYGHRRWIYFQEAEDAADYVRELEAQVAEARRLALARIKLLNTPWANHDAAAYTAWREQQEDWLARTEPKELKA